MLRSGPTASTLTAAIAEEPAATVTQAAAPATYQLASVEPAVRQEVVEPRAVPRPTAVVDAPHLDPTPPDEAEHDLAVATFDKELLDSQRFLGFAPGSFANSAPLKAELQRAAPPAAQASVSPARPIVQRPAQDGPAPKPRSLFLAMAQRGKLGPTAAAERSPVLRKLFGEPQEPGPALAYAAPDGGVLGDGQSRTPGRLPPKDELTAVYDISARTVYMPDGTKLEAHSGLGNRLDDPRHVHEKMRGATPPHVYDLTMRESLFHGVQALRLNPVGGEGAIFGRTGLLAHTYMLGPNGDSNGCVSFKNYDAFLRAYLNNKVKRLVVVARLG